MKTLYKKFAHVTATGLLTLATVNTSVADDIDLYVTSTTGSADVKPNVLFIIDSSGSMDAVDVPVTTTTCTSPADPDLDISGYQSSYEYPGDYESDRIYFYRSEDELPSAGGEPAGSFLGTDNYCSSAQSALDATGQAAGHKLIAYRANSDGDYKWRSVRTGNRSNMPIECQADAGVHGETDSSTSKYADKRKNPSNEWTSDSSKQYDNWNKRDTYSLFSGNRLNYEVLSLALSETGTIENCTSVTENKERLQVVKDVANNLIATMSGINLGIMTFQDGGSEGGYVRKEVVDIDGSNGADTNKELLTNVVNAIDHNGSTPLGETLYESIRYFKGESIDFGGSTVTAAKDADGTYKSPITDSCQATNNIILLSDGSPYRDFNHNDDIQSYLNSNDINGNSVVGSYDCPTESTNASDSNPSRSCLPDVAGYLANNDLSTLPGNQYGVLYTIGFANDLPVMQDAANEGNGTYYQSNSYDELTETLNNIILRVLASDTTFLSPAVSVNAFNRLQHNDQIYYAMFSPDSNAKWEGNIKKYTIDNEGTILDSKTPAEDAINSATGYFKDTARSYWSATDDGKNTSSGGARYKQTTDRNVMTYTSATNPTGGTSVNLNQTAHKIVDGNTAITQAMLGAASADDRTALIKWAQGYNYQDTSEQEKFIGDPLHSRPTVVVYGGTSSTNQDTSIFFGTNEGFLHSIDGETGLEEFAFIPQELLPNLKDYATDKAGVKTYGLDGEVTIWKNDLNNNGVIYDASGNLETGEGVYLYIGMRRGGSNYYGLDITDRTNPKLMWVIEGGSGDFAELGQSWSKPALGQVSLNGVKKQVLFIGGGYDTDQDGATVAQVDDIGRSVFMVDAQTGAKLWSAGPNAGDNLTLSGMNYSIPNNLTVGDMDNDSLTDIIFAANVGGEVWRFDLDNDGNTGANSLATGGKILDINGTTESENRKFFSNPDVSLFAPRGQAPYFLISIGSGTRPSPLDETVANRFYVKKEYSPYEAPKVEVSGTEVVQYTTTTEAQLYDATDNDIQTGSDAEKAAASAALASSKGWYIKLNGVNSSGTSNDGEKVISGSVTFGGKVIFTSYTPDFTSIGTGCELNLGIARLYVLDILDAAAAVDLNNDGTIDGDDRAYELKQTGLPAPANIIHTASTDGQGNKLDGQTDKVVCVGTECFDDILDGDGGLTKSYWREN